MTDNPTTIIMFCDPCGDDREFVRESRKQTHAIRGEQITAVIPLLVCRSCGHTQPDHTTEIDSLQLFHEEYRRRHKMLTPNRVRSIRERYALSHEAFAALVGMSPATLYRYEAGALQDEVNDSLIYACEHPDTMQRLVRRRQDRLSPLQLKRVEDALRAARSTAAPKELAG